MNKILLVFALLIFIGGCAGQRNAIFGVKEDGFVHHNDTNLSFLEPSIGPEQMARAKLIDSQAAINNAIARSMESPTTSGTITPSMSGKFKIAFTNNDPERDAYFYNPEIPGQSITLTSGGGSFILPQNSLPGQIDIYSGKRVITRFYPQNDFQNTYGWNNTGKKMFNGQEVDLRYAIWKIGTN